jgi:hypothetical protein
MPRDYLSSRNGQSAVDRIIMNQALRSHRRPETLSRLILFALVYTAKAGEDSASRTSACRAERSHRF